MSSPAGADGQAGAENAATREMEALGAILERLDRLTETVRSLAASQPLVDLQVAADHLGVSTRTLRRMCAAGKVPFRRVGRALRFQLALLAPRSAQRP